MSEKIKTNWFRSSSVEPMWFTQRRYSENFWMEIPIDHATRPRSVTIHFKSGATILAASVWWAERGGRYTMQEVLAIIEEAKEFLACDARNEIERLAKLTKSLPKHVEASK